MDSNDRPMEQSQSANTSPPLGELIGKIMADKDLMNSIASVMGNTSSSSQASDKNENNVNGAAAPNADESPQSAQKLPDMIEALSPILGSGKGDIKNALLNAMPQKDDRRICLLRAIKPYVSRGRSEAIDYMIQLSKISELIKHLN